MIEEEYIDEAIAAIAEQRIQNRSVGCPFSNQLVGFIKAEKGYGFCKVRCVKLFPEIGFVENKRGDGNCNCPCTFFTRKSKTIERFWREVVKSDNQHTNKCI